MKSFPTQDADIGITYARLVGGVIEMARLRNFQSHTELAQKLKWGAGGAMRLRAIEAGRVDPTFEELAVIGHVAFLGVSGLFELSDEIANLLGDNRVPVFRTRKALGVWLEDSSKRQWPGSVYDLFLRYAPQLNYEWDDKLQHVGQFRYIAAKHPELLLGQSA